MGCVPLKMSANNFYEFTLIVPIKILDIQTCTQRLTLKYFILFNVTF